MSLAATIASRLEEMQRRIEALEAIEVPVGGASSGARVYSSTGQNIADATSTALNFNSERYDTDDYHDAVTNNTRLTIPVAGVYDVGADVRWEAYAGGIRRLTIRLNDSQTIVGVDMTDNGTDLVELQHVNTIYDFLADDYVEVVVYQDAGTSLNLGVGEGAFLSEAYIQRR